MPPDPPFVGVPVVLAPEARELLLAFCEWCSRPEHLSMMDDDEWTVERLVDLFVMEASI